MIQAKIQSLLEKLGITNYNQLSAEERDTLASWNAILSQGEITSDTVLKNIKDFREKLLDQLDPDNTPVKNYHLLAQYKVVKLLLRTLESPRLGSDKLQETISNIEKTII